MEMEKHLRSTFPMVTTSRLTIVLLLIATAGILDAGPPPALNDPFLDNFVGDWSVIRKMGDGRAAETTVHGEWVLRHQFVELHYGRGGKAPEYEALVFIGFDDAAKGYVCHWLDVFGGRYSGIGRGRLDQNLLGIEFRFDSQQGSLTNKFVFDPATKRWTSAVHQEENGQWKIFAEEKWTKK